MRSTAFVYKRQELFDLLGHQGFLVGSVVFIFFSFLCCIVLFVFVLLPMLPVSLDCSFLIASSVVSNVYLSCVL
jgi:hypothetical protein